ncbi:MAG: hydrogenase expression/formation protein HypE [Candidatus Omnitrophota bacterium]
MVVSDKVLLAHGAGGRTMHKLIKEFFVDSFDNPILAQLTDAAILNGKVKALAFTTDSYVVNPIFFSGGDIGKLAICGTINDLSVVGARPLYISCGFIIEEGLELSTLKAIVQSMKGAAKVAGVRVVTGDTKVVEKGKVDSIFINTSGIGIIEGNVKLGINRIKFGDVVIINGFIGEHEIAVLSRRGGFDFKTDIKSDCAPLNGLISNILKSSADIKFMRDPTRGGLATVLNEIVEGSNFGIELNEKDLPISEGVQAACELLGFEPIYLANEGKVVVIVGDDDAKRVLNIMRRHPLGKNAKIVGEVVRVPRGKVILNTKVGGRRLIEMLAGEQLPRIC